MYVIDSGQTLQAMQTGLSRNSQLQYQYNTTTIPFEYETNIKKLKSDT